MAPNYFKSSQCLHIFELHTLYASQNKQYMFTVQMSMVTEHLNSNLFDVMYLRSYIVY
jgi:hypothetical protein